MMDGKQLIKEFEDQGLFYYKVMGVDITDNMITFYLDENESLTASIFDEFRTFAYERDWKFDGVDITHDYVVSDEYLEWNSFDDPSFVFEVRFII